MDIEQLRALCLALPHATEDVKWGNDLCFCIGGKMFCVTGLTGPFGASFKVRDEEFEEMCARPSIMPAPYVARYKWVYAENGDAMPDAEWAERIRTSYSLVADALPAKVRKGLERL